VAGLPAAFLGRLLTTNDPLGLADKKAGKGLRDRFVVREAQASYRAPLHNEIFQARSNLVNFLANVVGYGGLVVQDG